MSSKSLLSSVSLIAIWLSISIQTAVAGPSDIALQYRGANDFTICSGEIFGPTAVVIEAHCVDGLSTAQLSALAGEGFGTDQQSVGISKVIIHENYNSFSGGGDVAVLELDELLTWNENVSALNPITQSRFASSYLDWILATGAIVGWNPDLTTLAHAYADGASVFSNFVVPFCYGDTTPGSIQAGTSEQFVALLQTIPGFFERALSDTVVGGYWSQCANFSFSTPCALYEAAGRSMVHSPYGYASYLTSGFPLTQAEYCFTELNQLASPANLSTPWITTSVVPLAGSGVTVTSSASNDFRQPVSILASGGIRNDGTNVSAAQALETATEVTALRAATELRSTYFNPAFLSRAHIPQSQMNYVLRGFKNGSPLMRMQFEQRSSLTNTISDFTNNYANFPFVPTNAAGIFTTDSSIVTGELATLYTNMLIANPAVNIPGENTFLSSWTTNVGAIFGDVQEQMFAFAMAGGFENAVVDPTYPYTGAQIYRDANYEARLANAVPCADNTAWRMGCHTGNFIESVLIPKWTQSAPGAPIVPISSRDLIFPPTYQSLIVGVYPTAMDQAAGMLDAVFARVAKAIGIDNSMALLLKFSNLADPTNLPLWNVGPLIIQASNEIFPGNSVGQVLTREIVARAVLKSNLNIAANTLPETSMLAREPRALSGGASTCRGGTNFTGSSIGAVQPSLSFQVATNQLINRFTNCNINLAQKTGYHVHRLSDFSQLGWADQLRFFKNDGTSTSGIPNADGTPQYTFRDMEPLSNQAVVIVGAAARFAHERILDAAVTGSTFTSQDVNALGYTITDIQPYGFAFNFLVTGSTPTSKTVTMVKIDPSEQLFGTTHHYSMVLTLTNGQVFNLTENSGPITLPDYNGFKFQATRAANPETGSPALSYTIYGYVHDLGVRDFVVGMTPTGPVPSVR